MLNLVQYQSDAVNGEDGNGGLVKGFRELVMAGKPNATMVLKAPTGSGKTVMIAAMLEQLRNEAMDDEFVYIWASMGDLAHQSYEKLSQQYLTDSEYSMIELTNLPIGELPTNTILFCNWEKLYQIKKDKDDDGNEIELFQNVYVRIGEDGRNLQNILELTRNAGKKIILIVDEAHRTYLGENSQKLVERVIRPNLVIEISATPLLKMEPGYFENNTGRWIEVPLRKVIDSGLIKNNTIINNDIAGSIDQSSTDTAVLAAALKQREILAKKYQEQGTSIKPLLLIQLPTESTDKMSDVDETTRETVENFMESQGITYENGKLAIWVSGNYIPENVKTAAVPNDSPIEVLIFKQAIATGWDCPRASILVMLRDIKSVIFEIQTVGRILRMPELKHYDDAALNTAYVYTNINKIALSEDEDTRTFFKTRFSHRVDDFSDSFIWPNVYRKRVVGQRHRLNQNFRPKLFSELNKRFDISKEDNQKTRFKKLDGLLDVYPEELTIPILSDVAFEHLDELDQQIFENSQHVNITADKAYIERTFNLFLKSACSPYAPHDSSRILKAAIYKWFSDNGFDDEADVQRIIACSQRNQDVLLAIIGEAKKRFGETMGKETELTHNSFSIPLEQEFGEGYEPFPAAKHILQPYYRPKNMWDTESKFEKAIDSSDSVDWWYRNGVSEPKYFGIPYLKMNRSGIEEESIFYPDYIVKFTDGTYGIFDTKSGDTTKPGTDMGGSVDEKANGLQGFLHEYGDIVDLYRDEFGIKTTKMSGIWGGIVNVGTDGRFGLQADAIDQDMARDMKAGKIIKLPEFDYNPSEWNWLDLNK